MNRAQLGYQARAALETSDKKALEALFAEQTKGTWPCKPTEAEASEEDAEGALGDSECESAPVEDECAGVSKELSIQPSWTCDKLLPAAGKAPAMVFCHGDANYPGDDRDHSSHWAEGGIETRRQLVRTAFLLDGRLHVADWPAPSRDIYETDNVTGLADCERQTATNQCRHECEVKFNRYHDPCAGADGYEYDYDYDEGDGEAEPEPESVRIARETAEREEREAREASEELQYQECLAPCDEAPEGAESGPPDRLEVDARLGEVLAPGVFRLEVDHRYLDSRQSRALAYARTFTLVVENAELAQLAEKGALSEKLSPGAPDRLDALEVIAELEDDRAAAFKLSPEKTDVTAMPARAPTALWTTDSSGRKVLTGVANGALVGWAFAAKAGQPRVAELDRNAVCAIFKAKGTKLPEAVAGKCEVTP